MNHITRSTLSLFAFAAISFGEGYVSPAQGPPLPAAGVVTREIPVSIITSMLKTTVNQKLADLNTSLAAKTDTRAKLSLASVTASSPWPSQTEFTDRPNHRYAKILFNVEISVHDIEFSVASHWVSYPWNRTIYMDVQVNNFCNGWQTGSGQIQITAQPQTPYLDPDPGITESIVDFFLNGYLVDYVNAQIRPAISTPGAFSQTLGATCNTLQAFSGDPNTHDDDAIRWTEPLGIHIPNTRPAVTVRPTRIKRLVAHTLENNSVLYDLVENPVLEFWAGFSYWSVQLPPMTEGQEIVLSETAKEVIPRLPGSTSLVVIANTVQKSASDSNYVVFNSSQNYGDGAHGLQVYKTYWTKPRPPAVKPMKATVAGYEVTFEVVNPSAGTIGGVFLATP